jgi:phospholipase C
MRSFLSISLSAALVMGAALDPAILSARQPAGGSAATPIQHVVIIFGENISFDHYFGTYPSAMNPPGQPKFKALPGTPPVNGLTPALLTNNPNLNPANGTGASNPFRLNRSQALTADQNHNYGPEQASFDLGAMDLFPVKTGVAGAPPSYYPPVVSTKGLVMGYYDGNTVTALWNYAQRYAMNDNSYNTQFGPSTPGALNLIAGQTNGVNQATSKNGPGVPSFVVPDGVGGFTMVGDADPLDDVCSASTRYQVDMTGKNVGDLLNAAGVTWGWFNGGFDVSATNPNGTTGCARSTVSPVTGLTVGDYVPHHQPFQYYASTKNPLHSRPSSLSAVGFTNIPGTSTPDPANHQYDLTDWFGALGVGNLPAVSFLKSQAYQDAHPGNSNPLDEQTFVVNVINALQQSSFWNNTAVIIAYDDSDGWYDHQMGPISNGSFYNPSPTNSQADALSGPGACGTKGTTAQLPGPGSNGLPVDGRCGYGVRTPLLVISPWAKQNYVDHTITDQTSVLRFIEDNWLGGQRIGGGSFDVLANSINGMFVDFGSNPVAPNSLPLLLTPTSGELQ